ncbi:MAG TPA: hypothetical protein VNI78_01055 [Vicinamibacterales bacterium]|nr:hypothetical protein [Vicinamibacterales bacterium]
MPEVLRTFAEPIRDESGSYHARVVGRRAADGMWEGWLEFEALDRTGETLVGPVESRQPEREHLVYWAGGLTPVFLEGALHRARSPLVVRTRIVEEPRSSSPAPRMVRAQGGDARPEAILDPFEVGGRSLDILDQELRALNRPRLLNIIAAYDLNPAREDLSWMTDAQLVRFIVVAVDAQLIQRAR